MKYTWIVSVAVLVLFPFAAMAQEHEGDDEEYNAAYSACSDQADSLAADQDEEKWTEILNDCMEDRGYIDE